MKGAFNAMKNLIKEEHETEIPVVKYFGGVSMMTAEQFDSVNGLSNLYWGWGGEDDDLYFRMNARGNRVLYI